MLGVTVLILVISVMTGFDRELRQKVIDFDAHILVTGEEVLTNWRDLTEKIRATPRVVATAPYVQGPVIVEHNEQRLAPLIRGIDPEQEGRLAAKIYEGRKTRPQRRYHRARDRIGAAVERECWRYGNRLLAGQSLNRSRSD